MRGRCWIGAVLPAAGAEGAAGEATGGDEDARDGLSAPRHAEPIMSAAIATASEAPPRTVERAGSASLEQCLIARPPPPQHAGKRVPGAPVPGGRENLTRLVWVSAVKFSGPGESVLARHKVRSHYGIQSPA